MVANKLTGECQCGKLQYRIDEGTYRLNVCHCHDCQKQSGSAFGMSLVVKPDTFHIRSGELSTFVTTSNSGRKKICAFCSNCGVRIYNATDALMAVKAGTLDDTSQLNPDAHYWTKRKQTWVPLPRDVPCFEEID